jgi:A/G-specific adenine glycosylase
MHKIPFITQQKALLNWFIHFGRKDLPWQKNKTPYRVWVSEIMLQQTQVATVIPYFIKFIARFPSIEQLANAEEDEVLHLWTGLGYYSRARNLHRCAKILWETKAGQFPKELAELESLPGIGRSTAGAILALGFKKKGIILDGNVKRVLSRLFAIKTWPGEKKTQDHLWSLAEKLTPDKKVEHYTQAIMDLGATVCVRGKPQCNRCPWEKFCLARQEGLEKNLPFPKPKKIMPIKTVTLLIMQQGQRILLEKRSSKGIWGGLWSLPEMTDHVRDKKILQEHCQYTFQIKTVETTWLDTFRHTFSHFHLDILPVLLKTKKTSTHPHPDTQKIWYDPEKPSPIGLPGPIKKLLEKI